MKIVSYLIFAISITETKEVIHGISGTFEAGSLIGILGPSGAGKSTILNALSGFNSEGMQGKILINGQPRDMNTFKKQCSYIAQENALHGLLTVEENMKFAVDLKLGYTMDEMAKDKLIEGILDAYSLSEIRDTRTSKISGGQMKRLSVALELISNPSVMFLDEPTTGLDSFTSHQCIENLKDLARKGKTIICTIHQPSASIFQLFDHVYILANGNCLYQGGTENLLIFLKEIGMPCNIFHNPADYVLELASGEYGQAGIDVMIQFSGNGSNRKYLKARVEEISNGIYQQKTLTHKYNAHSSIYEFKTLLHREFLKLSRNMFFTYLRICATIINGLMMSTIYWNLGGNASKIWFNYNLILAIIINLVLCGVMITLLVVPAEMTVLKKEHFNRYYKIRTYYASITLLDLPITIVSTSIANVLILYLTGQPMEMHRVAMIVVIGIVVGLVAQSVGLLIGTCLSLKNAVFMGSYLHMPVMLLSGYGLLLKDIPPFFNIISYGCYMRYAVSGMNVAIYGYNRKRIFCPDDEFCFHTSGYAFLKEVGIEADAYWTNLGVLVLFYFVFRIITYVAMNKIVAK